MKKIFAVLACVFALSLTASAASFDINNIGEHSFALSTTASSGSALADVTYKFANTVKELSGGKIEIEVYEGSALGSEAQNLEALTSGTLDLAIIAVEFYVNSIPEVGALILPYQYSNYDQVLRVLEGPAGDYANERLKATAGVRNLGYYVMAFRQIYADRPIRKVADLAGFKIRVPESALYVETFKMLGAAPTPLPMGEVYTALDTGVINGAENTPDTALHNSWFEVVKNMNLTNHLNAPTTFSMSNMIFETLNDDEKALMLEAGRIASHYGLESTKKSDSKYREDLAGKMTVVEPDVAEMRSKIDYSVYPFMKSPEAKKLFELVQASLK